MDNDLTWEQYLEKVRLELEELERKKSRDSRKREVLFYMASHPKSGAFDDLMDVNGIDVKGKALLRYKKNESCDILECLYCENSAYEIILESGNGIKNGQEDINSYPFDHEILFYDIIPTEGELFSYLFDEHSRYKIIRKVDNAEIIDTTSMIRPAVGNKKLVK
ncbi:MAG: hypothetical protein IJI58_06000 [Bacilli bacterium]|nr:hypothetical protein [Bacilli bacterium]